MGYWTVPRIWPDGECFILGGGPSLRLIDPARLHSRRVIAVNQAYKLGQWDVMFYGDRHWLNQYGAGLLDWAGLKVTTHLDHDGRRGIRVVERVNTPFGITPNPAKLRWNQSSGACAINLAVHFGVRRIVLLGFDMRRVEIDGKEMANYHEDYPHDQPGMIKKNPYGRFLRPFPKIAADLEGLGIECVNATPGSAIRVFEIVNLEEVLDG